MLNYVHKKREKKRMINYYDISVHLRQEVECVWMEKVSHTCQLYIYIIFLISCEFYMTIIIKSIYREKEDEYIDYQMYNKIIIGLKGETQGLFGFKKQCIHFSFYVFHIQILNLNIYIYIYITHFHIWQCLVSCFQYIIKYRIHHTRV